MQSITSTELTRYAAGKPPRLCADVLAAEEPLELRVEGHSIAVIMRTPGHDRELAAGFLLTEGIIESARDLFDITTCVESRAAGPGNVVDAALARPEKFDATKFTRHVFTSSSCGICGQTSIEAVLQHRPPLDDHFELEPALLLRLPALLAQHQENFQQTGGLHACALFDCTGALLQLREDVGRHNALDKLIGWAALGKRTPLRETIVLLSGRVSFEMMQKAHAGGIALVAAISAPSSLAVQYARESAQTLVGFLRGETMNIYAGAHRLGGCEPSPSE